MINSYIILNRKTSLITNIFIINILILFIFIIWCINNFYYKTFIQFHSKIIFFNSFYYMEVLVPVNEINQIKNKLCIIEDYINNPKLALKK